MRNIKRQLDPTLIIELKLFSCYREKQIDANCTKRPIHNVMKPLQSKDREKQTIYLELELQKQEVDDDFSNKIVNGGAHYSRQE